MRHMGYIIATDSVHDAILQHDLAMIYLTDGRCWQANLRQQEAVEWMAWEPNRACKAFKKEILTYNPGAHVFLLADDYRSRHTRKPEVRFALVEHVVLH